MSGAARIRYSASSVLDAMANDLTVCSYSGNPALEAFAEVYPTLQIHTLAYSDLVSALTTSRFCHAALLPKINYDRFKMEKESCSLSVVETLFATMAGWASSRGGACVIHSLEIAMCTRRRARRPKPRPRADRAGRL